MIAAGAAGSLGILREFAGKRKPQVEHCDLCGAALSPEHTHLVEPKTRKLACACEACTILFSSHTSGRYKRVPRRIQYLPDLRLTSAQWNSLLIPINMAFFFESSTAAQVIALYPSPAGATESQPAVETWRELLAENPALRQMEPDVEALLVNRLGPMRGFPVDEYYLLPIDECYKLVSLVRVNWRGLSGGTEMWEKLQSFFADLKARSGG
jgi:Family of unknown function (DUF5947)